MERCAQLASEQPLSEGERWRLGLGGMVQLAAALAGVRVVRSRRRMRPALQGTGAGTAPLPRSPIQTGLRWNPARSGHIFRNAPGHVNPANAQARQAAIQEFIEVASKPANLRADAVKAGIITQQAEQSGVQAYTSVNQADEQIWVIVRGNEIINAGKNLPGAHR